MHFGSTLRLLRTDAKVSLRALAQAVGVSSAYLSRVENGHDAVPTPDRLIAISRALGLPSLSLLELTNKVTPFVAGYVDRVPAASALFAQIARRNLSGPELARVRAFIDAEFPAAASDRALSAPRLGALLGRERTVLGMSCSDFDDVIEIAATRLAEKSSGPSAPELARAVLQREREAPSALGEGVCVPHALVRDASPRAALVTLAYPLQAPTPDGVPLSVAVVLLLDGSGSKQLELLAQVARLAVPGFRQALADVTEPRRALSVLDAFGA